MLAGLKGALMGHCLAVTAEWLRARPGSQDYLDANPAFFSYYLRDFEQKVGFPQL